MLHYIKTLLVVSFIFVAGTAYAAETIKNDALIITQAKISMTQAIAAAEQHVNGKATRAEF